MTLRQDSHDSSVTIGPMKTRSCTPPPRSLRILMIAPTSFFADYGCHVRILEEITALQRLGHRVRLCTYHNGRNLPGIDIRRSVDVPWLKRAEVGSSRHKAYLDLALFAETLRQLVAFRPDVIHSHLHEGALIGGVLGRLARRPVVFDYQGSLTEEMLDHGFIRKHGLRERFFRRIERRIDRIADSVVPSGVAARRYLECSGLDPSRIRDIPDAVDLARFDPMAASAGGRAIREQLGIPPGARVVVYLGLLAEYQGTSLLIDAAASYLPRHPDVYFIVAGYPGAEIYAHHAKERGIADRVIFPGKILYEDAPALLAAGDIAIAPKLSTTESNGKIFNYMAMELPTVATDTPTNRAILGGLGHLFQPGDIDGLIAALDAAFADGSEARAELRERIRAEFDWSHRVDDLLAVYQSLISGQRAPEACEAAPSSPSAR